MFFETTVWKRKFSSIFFISIYLIASIIIEHWYSNLTLEMEMELISMWLWIRVNFYFITHDLIIVLKNGVDFNFNIFDRRIFWLF